MDGEDSLIAWVRCEQKLNASNMWHTIGDGYGELSFKLINKRSHSCRHRLVATHLIKSKGVWGFWGSEYQRTDFADVGFLVGHCVGCRRG